VYKIIIYLYVDSIYKSNYKDCLSKPEASIPYRYFYYKQYKFNSLGE